MALGAIIGGISLGAGLIGSLTQKTPRYNMSAMNEALSLINKQYTNVEEYFKTAGQDLEQQYGTLYGQEIQNAVNQLAGTGIYESPVAERQLGRKRAALAETYATAKSQLAGQKATAIGQIDQQRVNYLQNLAQLQYNRQLARQQNQSQFFGTLGGLGSALIGL